MTASPRSITTSPGPSPITTLPSTSPSTLPPETATPPSSPGVEDGEGNVEDALGVAGGAAKMEGSEARGEGRAVVGGGGGGREEVAEEEADGADVDVFEPMDGVDVDGDGGGVGVEEVVVDAEDELVVPCGVCAALRVDSCGEFHVRVDPGDSVGVHVAGHWGEVLGRYHIQLQQLEPRHLLRHCLIIYINWNWELTRRVWTIAFLFEFLGFRALESFGVPRTVGCHSQSSAARTTREGPMTSTEHQVQYTLQTILTRVCFTVQTSLEGTLQVPPILILLLLKKSNSRHHKFPLRSQRLNNCLNMRLSSFLLLFKSVFELRVLNPYNLQSLMFLSPFRFNKHRLSHLSELFFLNGEDKYKDEKIFAILDLPRSVSTKARAREVKSIETEMRAFRAKTYIPNLLKVLEDLNFKHKVEVAIDDLNTYLDLPMDLLVEMENMVVLLEQASNVSSKIHKDKATLTKMAPKAMSSRENCRNELCIVIRQLRVPNSNGLQNSWWVLTLRSSLLRGSSMGIRAFVGSTELMRQR
ncbi:hypothetical protein Fmac_002078 [Flemingia macrophylla]|uniref:Uncharacterized protein n=1 Tax=Flemingia macrophylla TaxID=520843 RepID=A0ABD1NKK8_9FABA